MRELIDKLKYRTDHIEELWEEARFKAKDAEKDRPWHRYVYLYVSDYVNKLEDEVYEIKDTMRDEFLKNGTVIAGELISHCIIVLKDKHFHYITAYEGAQYGYLSDVKEISELAYNELIK